MNRRTMTLAGAAVLLSGAQARAGASTAPSETATIATAFEERRRVAAASGKGVLILFHASWCGLCPYMARLLTDTAVTAILGPHFDLWLVRARETQRSQRAQQYAGADAFYLRFAREEVGMPFVAIVDAAGVTIATSLTMGENIGYPTEPFELDGFEAMLRTAAPTASAAQLAQAREAAVRLAPQT